MGGIKLSVEYVKDVINYEELIGEGQSQTMVNGDIVISERDGDVSKVLYCDGEAVVLNCQVVEDRVIVEGRMNFRVYYSSNDTRNIYKVEASSNFTHNIQIPGARNEHTPKVEAEIEHMEYQVTTNKKIRVNAVINLKGHVYNRATKETIVDIKGQDVQMLRESVEIDEYLRDVKEESMIKAEINSEKEIEEIAKTEVFVYKRDYQVLDGKVLINATAKARMLVKSKDGEYFMLEQDIPFSHEVVAEEVKPNMKIDVMCKVKEVYAEVQENEEGERKVVSVQANVEIYVKVYSTRQLQNILDAYSSDSRYEFEKENIKCFSYHDEATDSQVLKDRITVPEDEAIVEVKYVDAKPVITEVKVLEDKATCEGILRCNLVYVKAKEEPELEGYEEELPFKFTLDIPMAKIDMLPICLVKLESLSYEKFADKEVNVKANLVCHMKLYKKSVYDILKSLKEIDITEMIKNMSSLVIYTVQPHDTLWKIAKKYGTKVEDIVKLNDIENPDYIEPGMKIIVPKKTFMK